MNDDSVPTSPAEYRADYERRPGIPEGVTIDTKHPRFVAATEVAHRARLSQAQFSALLGHEIETQVQAQRTAPKPSAPPPAAPKVDYDKLSFAQKLALGGHV